MNKEQKCVFRMYAGIIFNRPIDTSKDYISPGGYTFVMDGREVTFDFEYSSGDVYRDEPNVFHIETKNPDWGYIGQNITEEMLRKVTDIKEFFVYTGEAGETDLEPVGLKYVEFWLPHDNWREIHVDANVVRAACVSNK